MGKIQVNNTQLQITLKEFFEKRNQILIVRKTGGLGDILMHRMMFEDFKALIPDGKLIFACPPQYHDAVVDHPFVDEVIPSLDVDQSKYVISYDTTTACTRHEMSYAPLSNKNRSDIWANHCGVLLKNHNMHINLKPEIIEYGKKVIKNIRKGSDGPVVVFSPISAMAVKNLNLNQMQVIVEECKRLGMFIFGIHTKQVNELTKLGVDTVCGLTIPQWMGVINAADYVVAVDTSAFHFAGGIGKPLTGIFTFADGKVYGKYYKFALVQKHRDNGDWDCGPCYHWSCCPKTNKIPKPCLTEINSEILINGIHEMLKMNPISV